MHIEVYSTISYYYIIHPHFAFFSSFFFNGLLLFKVLKRSSDILEMLVQEKLLTVDILDILWNYHEDASLQVETLDIISSLAVYFTPNLLLKLQEKISELSHPLDIVHMDFISTVLKALIEKLKYYFFISLVSLNLKYHVIYELFFW